MFEVGAASSKGKSPKQLEKGWEVSGTSMVIPDTRKRWEAFARLRWEIQQVSWDLLLPVPETDIWQGPAVIYLPEQSLCHCLQVPEQDMVSRGMAQCLRLYEGPARDKVSNLWMYHSFHHEQQPCVSQIIDYRMEETKKKRDWAIPSSPVLSSENSELRVWEGEGSTCPMLLKLLYEN